MLGAIRAIRRSVRDLLARRLDVPEVPVALRRLRHGGFMPSKVVDVGAYHGEFAIESLKTWPNCRVICFEAQASAVARLGQLAAADSRIRVIDSLVGATDRDDVVLHVAETASSILDEHSGAKFPAERHRMVALSTVSGIRAESIDLLKIDVQGYELEVLRGAEQLLPRVRAILVELNLLDLHQNVPLLSDVVAWLREREFVPFDICGLTRRPLDNALWQADMIFVPVDSPMRSDKRWSAA